MVKGNSTDKRAKRVSPINKFFDIFLKIVSVCAGFALFLTFIAPYIPPTKIGLLPTLALVAPAVYLFNAILMLYWIVVWEWRYGVVMLLLILCCTGRVSLFLKSSPTQDHSNPNYRSMVKVLTYNVRSLIDDHGKLSNETVGRYLDSSNADIICLQEFYDDKSRKMDKYMPKVMEYNELADLDIRIFTKYPIIRSGKTFEKYDFESCKSLWADLLVGTDTLRVVNSHLESTSIKVSDSDYLTSSQIVTDNNRHRTVFNIARRYQRSCIARAEQARALASFIEESPYPILVAGDFNDTPASYAYNKISRGLTDSFRECGEGYSYTFRGFYNMLRIDYIFVGNGVTPHSYKVDRTISASDHMPVISHIKIDKTQPTK